MSLSRITIWVFLGGLCLVVADDLLGSTPGIGYDIGRVAVQSGAHPAAGNPQNVLLLQHFDGRCRRLPEAGQRSSFAATASASVSLEVSIFSCRGAAKPDVDCTWTLSGRPIRNPSCRAAELPTSTGRFAWSGWQGDVPIEIPDRVGNYDLDLSCSIRGDGSEIEKKTQHSLFVLYAEPMAFIMPAQLDWYQRAACWGSGLERRDSEHDVASAVLAGLYRYGQDHWRYGYAKRITPRHYSFELSQAEGSSKTIEYRFSEHEKDLICSWHDEPYCRCRWDALVASDGLCDFADCYTFSRIFRNITAVLGVGGLSPVVARGAQGFGFRTQSCASFDADFPGNVDSSAGIGNSYTFSNHSLYARDGTFFDATFNRVYDSLDDLYASSRTSRLGDRIDFPDSTLIVDEEGYGRFPMWTRQDGTSSALARDVTETSTGERADGVRFTGDFEFSEDRFRDRFNALNVALEIEVRGSGDAMVLAQLFKGSEKIADLPSWDSRWPSRTRLTRGPGVHTVSLGFSGEQIYRAALDGPYELRAKVSGVRGGKDLLKVSTESYRHEDFGELEAHLRKIEVRWLEPRRESSHPVPTDPVLTDPDPTGRLAVEVLLFARVSEVFGLEARLSRDGETVAYGGQKRQMMRGENRLLLPFPGVQARGFETSAPHRITVVLFDQDAREVDSLDKSFGKN